MLQYRPRKDGVASRSVLGIRCSLLVRSFEKFWLGFSAKSQDCGFECGAVPCKKARNFLFSLLTMGAKPRTACPSAQSPRRIASSTRISVVSETHPRGPAGCSGTGELVRRQQVSKESIGPWRGSGGWGKILAAGMGSSMANVRSGVMGSKLGSFLNCRIAKV